MLGLLLLPIVAAAIGWGTNYLAVRYLFWPQRPLRLGRFVLWGVIPRYREELAIATARIVAQRLLTRDDLMQALAADSAGDALLEVAAGAVRSVSDRLLPAIVPDVLRNMAVGIVTRVVEKEGRAVVADAVASFVAKVGAEIDVEGIIRDRILSISLDELESLAYEVMGRELRIIQWAGGVIGFVVGLVQLVIVWGLGVRI